MTEQRYWQNRETANIGLVSSVGRAPARQSGGHRFKSHSHQFVFVHQKKFLKCTQSVSLVVYYSDDCEEVPIRGTCTRKSLEATRLPPSSFAGSERASSSEVRASVEGCRALSFCPQNPTRSMPCEERSCVKSDLGDSASKPNCSCLTWPQIFFSRLSSDLVVSRLSFDFKIQGRELYSPFPLRDGNSTPVLNALPLKIK